jgi:hypothetical protein
MLAVSMPNSTLAGLVETATKCLARFRVALSL